MQMFNCMVGIVDSNGATLTEVVKKGISATEIILLRSIHGEDKITRIERQKDEALPEEKVRDHLVRTYGKKAVEKEFGATYRDLPRKFRMPDSDEDEEPGVHVGRARKARGQEAKVEDIADIVA
jgi:hypothetical protein